MCGINGIIGLKDKNFAIEKITAMNNSLRHRGPNDEGTYIEDKIAFGQRRLSIIDLSTDGHQPMKSHDGRYVLIYNGELYNYKDLKFELQRFVQGANHQAYLFQTNSDTEVIIAAYARWGADCVKHFNGMFAFAIWDTVNKELFISRDRLGIKPLYYFYADGIFAFSSEIRALLSANIIPRKLDADYLIDYLRYQTVHAPDTIVKGVKMLMPGHNITMKNDELKSKSYWSLTENISDESKGKSYKEICDSVNLLLTKSVERRLIADVPFGAFLSGGIDSSVIVGLMSKVSSKKVQTFSVTFDESEFSEAKYAQLIARKFNTSHHEIKLTSKDFLNELPNALKAMDHPSGDGPNTFVVSKATKNAGITMALSGLGGDELFAGYDVFKRVLELNKKQWLRGMPLIMRRAGGNIISTFKSGIAIEKISVLLNQQKINFDSFYPLSRQVLMDERIKSIVNYNQLKENRVAKIIEQIQLTENLETISKTSIAEISTYMQNVLLRDTDQMSMAHALEVRVPFMDHKLVEYVLGVQDKFKMPTSPKKLLVDSMGDLLPPEIVNRPKMGFTLPWKNWMKKELKAFCEEKIFALSKRNSFNETEVIKLWKEFLVDNPSITWSRIWYLVVLENYLQENGID
jgi:asparagine synthase (glutamine-hydrolysing)